MATQEETELQAVINQQQLELDELKSIVNRWKLNGAEDMFGGGGFQRYGGGGVRLDKNGIQMQTEGTEARFVYWVDEYETDLTTLPDAVVVLSAHANAQILASYGKWDAHFDGADGTTVEISAGTDSSFKATVVDNASAGSATDPAEIIAEHSQIDGASFIRLKADNIVDKDGNAIGGGGSSGMELVVKSADESVSSSTTLQDDDELKFSVGANEQWQFEGLLIITGDGSGDIKYTFAGPSGAVGGWDARGVSATGSEDTNNVSELGSTAVTDTGASHIALRFWGGIAVGSTGGSLVFQWAQNTSNANATTVHAGSYIKFQQAS